jgi:hypothetical protein
MGLIINHGSPKWWLSPDIWFTAVGASVTSAPGVANPIAGDPYNVWVKVSNPTDQAIDDWSLFILWAVPTVGPIPFSATTPLNETTIGVGAGTSKIFQAAMTWTPVFENGGHECLVAVTFNNSLPFPFPSLDGDAGPSNNWSIAQHNLGVVELKIHPRLHYAFQVCNSADEERDFVVGARQAPLAEVEWFMKGLSGDRKTYEKPGKVQSLGIVASAQPDPSELKAANPVLERVKVGPRSCRKFSLVGTLDSGTALIHVTQTIDERIVGGLSVLVRSDGK